MNTVPLNLGDAKWLKAPELRALMSVLNEYPGEARIVGGAVRDALLNIFWQKKRNVGDVDIASTLTPEENMKRLERAGIKVIPTGLKHGTVTAVIDKKHFEITTLRRDVSTDGRHAEVEYTDDWTEDAKRRDFTINALYLDMDGKVYDPLDGFKDLKAVRVSFIGDANKRIEEDALRILRFFRFSADIEVGGVDEAGMLACAENKSLIGNLSGERIWQEFQKILQSKRVSQAIPVLATIGILREILPDVKPYDQFLKYVKLEKKLKRRDVIGRLSCLLPYDEAIIKKTAKQLKLSNNDRDLLLKYGEDYPKHDLEIKSLRKVIYKFGKDVVIHNLTRRGDLDPKTLAYIKDYDIPEMPFRGQDLLDQGWPAGREVGAELKRLEQDWIEKDFRV